MPFCSSTVVVSHVAPMPTGSSGSGAESWLSDCFIPPSMSRVCWVAVAGTSSDTSRANPRLVTVARPASSDIPARAAVVLARTSGVTPLPGSASTLRVFIS